MATTLSPDQVRSGRARVTPPPNYIIILLYYTVGSGGGS